LAKSIDKQLSIIEDEIIDDIIAGEQLKCHPLGDQAEGVDS